MKSMKGIVLLLAANILIMVTLSITVPIVINVILPMFGIDVRGSVDLTSLVWAMVFGFGGAFISLAFSKQMARAMLDCYQITTPRTQAEQLIHGSVREIAARLNIDMPEVWIYESPDPNAFATGPSKNNSMVAVSTGLLRNLNEQEVKAVLAHEMGHVPRRGEQLALCGLQFVVLHTKGGAVRWFKVAPLPPDSAAAAG